MANGTRRRPRDPRALPQRRPAQPEDFTGLAAADALVSQIGRLLPPLALRPEERIARRTRWNRHTPLLAQDLADLLDQVPLLQQVGVRGEDLRTRRERVQALESLHRGLDALRGLVLDLLLGQKCALYDDCQLVLHEARLLRDSRVLDLAAQLREALTAVEGRLADRQDKIQRRRRELGTQRGALRRAEAARAVLTQERADRAAAARAAEGPKGLSSPEWTAPEARPERGRPALPRRRKARAPRSLRA